MGLFVGSTVLNGAALGTTLHRVASPARDASYHVGSATCTFVDTSRDVLDYDSSPPKPWSRVRTLVTEIRYPTRSGSSNTQQTPGAIPAHIAHGFPMVVFAHGYNVAPDIYAPLLDAWVRAGFVVVAPVFPDENPGEVAAQHGANTENDLINEPADITFVTHAILADAVAATSSCAIVHHLVNPGELALAGHSDGAQVVGMLSFAHGLDPQGASYQALRSGLKFKGTIVMSGAEDGIDPYGPLNPTPALLVIQSAQDQCNPARYSIDLYNDIGDNDKWFLALKTGHHLPPFDDTDVVDFNLVTAATIDFLRVAVTGTAPVNGLTVIGNDSPATATMVQGGAAPPMPGAYTESVRCALN
jgi:hypothetical protein